MTTCPVTVQPFGHTAGKPVKDQRNEMVEKGGIDGQSLIFNKITVLDLHLNVRSQN